MARKRLKTLLPMLLAVALCLTLAPCGAAHYTPPNLRCFSAPSLEMPKIDPIEIPEPTPGSFSAPSLEAPEIDPIEIPGPTPGSFSAPSLEAPEIDPVEIPGPTPGGFSAPSLEAPEIDPIELPEVDPESFEVPALEMPKTEDPKLAEHLLAADFVAAGEAAKGSTVEVSFSKAFLCTQVRPEEHGAVYTGYEAEEGKQFLVVKGEVTNLGTQELMVDDGLGSYPYLAILIYNGTISQGKVVLENEEKDALTNRLPAGKTLTCYVLYSVSEEYAETGLPAWLFFGCSDFTENVFSNSMFSTGIEIKWDLCDFLACWSLADIASHKYSDEA